MTSDVFTWNLTEFERARALAAFDAALARLTFGPDALFAAVTASIFVVRTLRNSGHSAPPTEAERDVMLAGMLAELRGLVSVATLLTYDQKAALETLAAAKAKCERLEAELTEEKRSHAATEARRKRNKDSLVQMHEDRRALVVEERGKCARLEAELRSAAHQHLQRARERVEAERERDEARAALIALATLAKALCERVGREASLGAVADRCAHDLRKAADAALKAPMQLRYADYGPLPCCAHGNALEDHDGTQLAPSCGCLRCSCTHEARDSQCLFHRHGGPGHASVDRTTCDECLL